MLVRGRQTKEREKRVLGKSHLVYGLTFGAGAALLLGHPAPPLLVLEAAVAGGLGGLAPDLDEPGSTISNAPRILGRVARRLLRPARRGPLLLGLLDLVLGSIISLAAGVLNVVSRLLSRLVRLLAGGHREGTHWFVVWGLLSIAVFAVTAPLTLADGAPYVAAGFCAGYLSHLISDGCTKAGIPLVPRTSARLHLLPRFARVRTGSTSETVFTTLYLLVFVLALVGANWSDLHRLLTQRSL